jgi:hypothetical protein
MILHVCYGIVRVKYLKINSMAKHKNTIKELRKQAARGKKKKVKKKKY